MYHDKMCDCTAVIVLIRLKLCHKVLYYSQYTLDYTRMGTENQFIRLNNGRLMPKIGLGTWQVGPFVDSLNVTVNIILYLLPHG